MASPEKPKKRPTGSWAWSNLRWLLGLTIIAVMGTGFLAWYCWDAILPWAQSTGSTDGKPIGESQGETLRNMALALGGSAAFVIGLPLAIWRSIVAHEQTKTANEQARTANEQAKIANKQAETAERGLNNERYQRGAEMLGSDMLATRIGGIYALEMLAREHPDEYHMQIIKLLCSFIRNPKKPDNTENSNEDKCPEDIHETAQVIRMRSIEQIKIEEKTEEYKLDLGYANLLSSKLDDANLSDAILFAANLTDLKLVNTNLSNAMLAKAILRGANLKGANLSGACLSGADFTGAYNLTQMQLDSAIIWKGTNPPKLDGTIDPETKKPFVWRGGECDLPDNVRIIDDDGKDK